MKTCVALFTYGFFFFFYWVRAGGICVNPCVSLSSGILLCVSYSSQITEARASAESS